eukprot:m.139598 g.139598  ORF g.139598 m.139598 type:complete len:258 (+) comp52554_c0_seq51:483-1256(+)
MKSPCPSSTLCKWDSSQHAPPSRGHAYTVSQLFLPTFLSWLMRSAAFLRLATPSRLAQDLKTASGAEAVRFQLAVAGSILAAVFTSAAIFGTWTRRRVFVNITGGLALFFGALAIGAMSKLYADLQLPEDSSKRFSAATILAFVSLGLNVLGLGAGNFLGPPPQHDILVYFAPIFKFCNSFSRPQLGGLIVFFIAFVLESCTLAPEDIWWYEAHDADYHIKTSLFVTCKAAPFFSLPCESSTSYFVYDSLKPFVCSY